MASHPRGPCEVWLRSEDAGGGSAFAVDRIVLGLPLKSDDERAWDYEYESDLGTYIGSGLGNLAKVMGRRFRHVFVFGNWAGSACAADLAKVKLARVPDAGIQPQVTTDKDGNIHLIYFGENPAQGDLYYRRSTDGATFSAPVQVNSESGSVV